MRNWVLSQNLESDLVDRGVYTRNRCFRMAGCCKYGQRGRPFLPGPPSSALVQCKNTNPRECGTEPRSLLYHTPTSACFGDPVGSFDVRCLNVYKKKRCLDGLEPNDLLSVITPDQDYRAFFAIGCAYKRAGGTVEAFCAWCSAYRHTAGVTRQWQGWNKSEKGYGYPFLKELALHSASNDEVQLSLDEAYGFHPSKFFDSNRQTHFDSQYLSYKHIAAAKQRCVLVKSPTGSGKSTVARELARRYSDRRILYIVSSRPLAYGAKSSLNAMGRTIKYHNTRPLDFASYLETDQPLWKHDHLVCSIQSLCTS